MFSKHAKDDTQETSLIEAVESVYGEQMNFAPETADNLENVIASTVAPKTRSDSPTMWFTPEIVESTAPDCDNSYPKDYFMDYSTNNQADRGGGAVATGILNGNNFVHDHDKDATDLLFLSYSKTLKSFSKKRQVQIKMKISQIMGQAELDDEEERTGESNHVDSSENNHERGKVKITHVGKKFKYS